MFRVKIVLQHQRSGWMRCTRFFEEKPIHRKRSKQDWKLLWTSGVCWRDTNNREAYDDRLGQ